MPDFLSLNEAGQLVPESDAARRWLNEKPGRWRVVPAADDLILLRREKVQGRAEGVRAVFCGDLQGLALGELLAFLAQSRWTGVLSVTSEGAEKSVFVKHGSVKWASSNLPSDRLGEIVQRLGLVSQEEIERVLARNATSGGKIGQILLAEGLIDTSDLYRAIKHQIQEIVFSCLLFERGLVFLFNDPVETRFGAQLSIDLNGLLMDGLRRIDEIGHFRKRIPGDHCYVVRRDREVTGLNEDELRVLELCDGRLTVAQIGPAAHMGEFDCIKTLFRLAEAGYVEISEKEPETTLGGTSQRTTTEAREVIRVFNAIFREIFDAVSQVAPTAGYKLGADSFLESGQHGYSALLNGFELDDEGKLPSEVLVERAAAMPADVAPDPAKYMCAALNEVMFFALFQAGELLPPERDDELSRRVKSIYALLEHGCGEPSITSQG